VELAHSGQREAAVNLPETLRPKLGSTAYATLYGSTREFRFNCDSFPVLLTRRPAPLRHAMFSMVLPRMLR